MLIIEFLQIQIPTDRTSGTRTRTTQMLTNTIVEICSTPLTTAPRRLIPLTATEFIKASGFKTQEKSCDAFITSCGVSVQDVRDHLIKVVPGHGISETSVRYLFKPVRKGTFAAESYKSVVDEAVTCKDNSLGKDNSNTHYPISRLKLRRELCSYFRDECTIASAD